MLIREFPGQTIGQNWHYLYRGGEGVEFKLHYHPEFELTFTRGAQGIRYVGSDVVEAFQAFNTMSCMVELVPFI